jgi:D-alanyl-lipoteichoic acid acyltransferase DltB (MBOAT superfamily)
LFTLGLVKKLVFADTIGEVVDPVFKPGAVASGWGSVAVYGFSMQIYCDFSGYTDMAIGLAYLLRIRLPTNFCVPTFRPRQSSSGAAGTSRCRIGSGTISTSRSAATASAGRDRSPI